jgi:hypothetical protein
VQGNLNRISGCRSVTKTARLFLGASDFIYALPSQTVPRVRKRDLDRMRVALEEVKPIPNCSISFGYGVSDAGEAITFAGERRMMQDLANRIAESAASPIWVEVENWQLWAVGDE